MSEVGSRKSEVGSIKTAAPLEMMDAIAIAGNLKQPTVEDDCAAVTAGDLNTSDFRLPTSDF